jgi:hypothetical protein
MSTDPYQEFKDGPSVYYPRGAIVDVTIRGASISDHHVQDRRLWLMLPDGADVHIPLPLPQSITVRQHGDQPTGSLHEDVAQALSDWLFSADDSEHGADAILAIVARSIRARADVESEHRDGTNYTNGWLDAADHVAAAIVAPEAAFTPNDRPGGAA